MTTPLPQPEDQKRVNWLFRYISVQQLYDRKVVAALTRAAYDAGEAAEKLGGMNIGDRTKRYQINLVRNEIRSIIKDMFKDFVPILNKGQQDAAEEAAKAALAQDAQVLRDLFSTDRERKMWEASFIQTARHGIASMIMRVTKTEMPLSKRVYKSSVFANGLLDNTINSHIARNSSAQELAKAVRKSIRNDAPGGVSYAAMRLARSEINNAFHAMSIEAAQEFPWVDDVEWHLSKVHRQRDDDLCDYYAAERYFPTDDVPPKPHPQCMCYIVTRQISMQDFATKLESGVFDEFFTRKYGVSAA